MSIKAEIAVEMYEAARRLGARSDLLRIIGSYGDTLPDEEVLDQLRQWNWHAQFTTAARSSQSPTPPFPFRQP